MNGRRGGSSAVGGLLEGLRVLEIGDEPSIGFCGWMFSNNGAEVLRQPAVDERSHVSRFLHTGKRTLSSTDLAGEPSRVSIVIAPPDYDWSQLEGLSLLAGTVDPLQEEGTRSEWVANELILASLGGSAQYTQTSSGVPVYGFGRRYQYLAGLYLYVTLLAKNLRETPPIGPDSTVPHVRVSNLETVVSYLPYITTQFQYNGTTSIREQSGPRYVSRCTDGWVVVYAGGSPWSRVANFLDRADLLHDERFESTGARFENAEALGELIETWTRRSSIDEVCAQGEQHSVATARVRSPSDALHDAELNASSFWQTPDLEGCPGLKLPRLPYTVDGRRAGHPCSTPSATPPINPADTQRANHGSNLPLEGTRILDLTHVWSGPFGTRVLACLGAEVLKVEQVQRADLLRGGPHDIPMRYPDLEPTDDAINRNAWFNTQNVDKRSLVIDAKHPSGRALILELAAISQALVVNYRPGVIDRLGLGYDDLRAVNPGIVLVEMPGYLPESKMAGSPAYGAQFDAASGACWLTGDPTEPMLTGFALGDPVGGLFAAAATVAALTNARLTGEGSHVVLAQSEAMLPLLGEYFAAESVGEPIVERLNGSAESIAAGIFGAKNGSDWLAVSADTEEQWIALSGEVAKKQSVPSEFGSPSWAIEHPDLVLAKLEDWVATLDDPHAMVVTLQTMKVPAGLVADGRSLNEDEDLNRAGYFRSIAHPRAGTHMYPGFPMKIDGERVGGTRPAPVYGQDTKPVLSRLLGLSNDDLAQLEADGVIIHHDSQRENVDQ